MTWFFFQIILDNYDLFIIIFTYIKRVDCIYNSLWFCFCYVDIFAMNTLNRTLLAIHCIQFIQELYIRIDRRAKKMDFANNHSKKFISITCNIIVKIEVYFICYEIPTRIDEFII